MSTTEPLMQVSDLQKHFPLTRGIVLARKAGTKKAVDGVSFEVIKGETLGIVGESGSGKTTMARLMMRLLEPTAGTVRFEGNDITHLKGKKLKAVRRELQMVFQDPYSSLNPRKTVGSIVGEPFAIHGLHRDRAQRREWVKELMDTVGLNPEHYNRYPHEFSGGQRQRIGIARALALRPKMIIADEPVSALDVSIQAQVLNLLADLQDDFGLSYLFIAHDLEVVRHVSNAVTVMYLGRVAEQGPGDQVYGHSRHPYSVALLSAAPAADPDAAAKRQRIILTGDVPSPINPPPGCRFHPRCPKAQDLCGTAEPVLETKAGDPSTHLTACHYPVEAGENLAAAGLREQP